MEELKRANLAVSVHVYFSRRHQTQDQQGKNYIDPAKNLTNSVDGNNDSGNVEDDPTSVE